MKEFTINILGSEWTVRICTEEEEPRLKDVSGFTDWTSRLIVVGTMPEDTTLDYPYTFMRKILRHEVIHAMMFESGLMDNWEHRDGQDEAVVDWIAIQLPKLWKVCGEAEGEMMILLLEEKKDDGTGTGSVD